MALNIKNPQVDQIVAEVVELTGETKTGAILQALIERQARLRLRVADESRGDRIRRFLEREIWPRVPAEQRGRAGPRPAAPGGTTP